MLLSLATLIQTCWTTLETVRSLRTQLTGFNNIIKSPTRVTENSSSVIDSMCTNNPTKIISSGVIDICITDQKFTYSSFKLIESRNPPPNIKDVKSYKAVKENPKPSQEDIKSVPWWICSILFGYGNI